MKTVHYQSVRQSAKRQFIIVALFSTKLCLSYVCFAALLGAASGEAQTRFSFDLSGNLQQIHSTNPVVAPQITQQARFLITDSNGTVSLSVVSPAASGMLTYQWFFGETTLRGQTNESLLLSGVQPSQLGAYQVLLTGMGGSVTSAVFNVDFDKDHDGLADSWEVTHFSNIASETGLQDFDNDGATNGEEFTDNTDPTDASSVLAKLEVHTKGASVIVSPLKAKYNLGEVVNLTAIPQGGGDFLGWFGSTNSTSNPLRVTVSEGRMKLVAQFGESVGDAVENQASAWRSGGDALWSGQENTFHQGDSAAESGKIGHNQQTWMETTVTNTETTQLRFWWKVSSESHDFLRLYINGQLGGEISGIVPWTRVVRQLPVGTNTLRWTFAKNGQDNFYGDYFEDHGWVDEVVFRPGESIPLADALDTQGWDWNTNSRFSWVGQDIETWDTLDSAQSKPIAPFEESWMETRVTIPILAQLQYWWREGAGNELTFARNGIIQGVAEGREWHQEAFFLLPGTNSLRWNYSNRDVSTNGSLADAAFVDSLMIVPQPYISLSDALDYPSASWRTSPIPWFGQTNISYDCISAAQSGPLSQGESSALELRHISRYDGVLSFWWRLGSAETNDLLSFSINGMPQAQMLGASDWVRVTMFLGAGTNLLGWNFLRRDAFGTQAHEGALLDQVRFIEYPNPDGDLDGDHRPDLMDFLWRGGAGDGSDATLTIKRAMDSSSESTGVYVGGSAGDGFDSKIIAVTNITKDATSAEAFAGGIGDGYDSVVILGLGLNSSSTDEQVFVGNVGDGFDVGAQSVFLSPSAPDAGSVFLGNYGDGFDFNISASRIINVLAFDEAGFAGGAGDGFATALTVLGFQNDSSRRFEVYAGGIGDGYDQSVSDLTSVIYSQRSEDETYEEWRRRVFTSAQLLTKASSEFGDLDGDRISNIIEYAIGTNPSVPGFTPPYSLTLYNGRLYVSIQTLKTAVSFELRVYESDDLSSPTWIPLHVERIDQNARITILQASIPQTPESTASYMLFQLWKKP